MYKIILICVALIFSACERKFAENGKVTILFPKPTIVQKMIADVTTFEAGAAPTSWSDVDCIGFMASGPDTTLNQSRCDLMSGATGNKIGDFYFGHAIGGFYQGSDVEFEVASGSDRVLTAIGFKTHMTTANGADIACKNILTTDQSTFSKPFLYAQSGKFKVEPGSTQTVTMPISYVPNQTPFMGDCSGPTAPGGGDVETPAGPPVKLVMRIQDDLRAMFQHSCVAMAFELQDVNGRLANVDNDYQFSVDDGSSNARFDTIDNRCETAGVPNSMSLPFFNGSQRFNRIILFLRTTSAATINFTFSQVSPASPVMNLLPVTNFNVLPYVNPSPNTPYRINLFDIHAFKGSKTTSASNPIEVKAGECRPMLAQVVDSLGYPVKVSNSFGASGGDDIVSTASFEPADPQAGLTNSSACAAVTPTHIVSITHPGGFSISGLNFFYFKTPATPGQYFNFKVDVEGSQYYNNASSIFDLDLTAATNNYSFWKVKN